MYCKIFLSFLLLINIINKYAFTYSLGENCILSNNTEGECVKATKCQKPTELQTTNCSNSLICCPFLTKSAEMCAKYGKELEHLKVHFVVGGDDALIVQFPHMAALGFGNKTNIEWNCGGSLISDRFILTAAHCLKDSSGEVKYVQMGDNKLTGESSTRQEFEIIRRIKHPGYKPPQVYHDIALLELDRPVEYSVYVKPACLDTEDEISSWSVTATGWGLLQYDGNRAIILQKVELDLFNNTECNLTFRKNRRRLTDGILEDRMVCAGGRDKGKDTCQGDSGGPLQEYRFKEGLHGIIGVTAFGRGCGSVSVPSVYSRVKYYAPWIESIVWPACNSTQCIE